MSRTITRTGTITCDQCGKSAQCRVENYNDMFDRHSNYDIVRPDDWYVAGASPRIFALRYRDFCSRACRDEYLRKQGLDPAIYGPQDEG